VVRYGGSLGDVRTVAVDTPQNDSLEPGLEYIVADALRREFLRRDAVDVVEDPSRADLVLEGRVKALNARGETFSSVVLALEFQLTLELDLRARRADGTLVPMDVHSLRETERYLASADVEVQRKNRVEAIRRVSAVVAERVYDSLYETLTQ